MELDDLKNTWKQDEQKQTKTPNIMEMIHQKSRGPIASLKTAFRKQMAAVTVLMSMIIVTNARNVDNISSNILFWTYIGFCIALIVAFYFNYQLTRKMETMDDRVKNNLEQHVSLLERRLRWQAIGARIVILFFILLLEIIPHYQHLRMLDKWHSLSPLVRFSSYAAFLVLQYFLSNAVKKNRFGKHIDHLKDLINELK
ncbi:MAG: hypothetical protein EOO46_19330 [Flavobacterium sp.]|nr:MAG: hypothetical protein EOO46_19330 [Flavobacterium sp.]